MKVVEKTITYQNTQIFYRVYGEGKTVVLIHGFAEDGEVWSKQVAFLQNHFKLIVPDLPGSGRSAFINNADIETYADVIKWIVDVEINQDKTAPNVAPVESSKVSLIGHSMGGYVTLAFAEKYPDYLNSFGLFHSTAYPDTAEKKEVRKKAISFMRDKGTEAFVKTSTPGLFTKDFAEANPDMVNGLIETGKNFTADTLVQYYEAMIARPDRTAVLNNFINPILYIIGEHDTAISLQSSLQQCYIPARSYVFILQNAAHMGMWEETDKANKILYEFLERNA